MKHTKLFEEFLNEKKMLKKDLKNLADEIAAQIPNLRAFTKFKQGKDDYSDIPITAIHNVENNQVPIAPNLSNIGYFINGWNRTISLVTSINNKTVFLFSIKYIIDRTSKGLYGNKTQYVSSFQFEIGEKSFTEPIPMILPVVATGVRQLSGSQTGREETAEIFIKELNKSLNSPAFAKLIKQYADAVNEFNSQF